MLPNAQKKEWDALIESPNQQPNMSQWFSAVFKNKTRCQTLTKVNRELAPQERIERDQKRYREQYRANTIL